MQAQAKSRTATLRWATLALSVFIVISCTALCTHIDKAGGDDGKGHCSICLGAAGHKASVQPIAAVHAAPELLIVELTANSDSLIKQNRFDSSLYIRPPPLS